MEEGEVEKVCRNCYFYRAKDYECENLENDYRKMFPLSSCSRYTGKDEVLTVEQVWKGITNGFKKSSKTAKERAEKAWGCMARIFSRKE